MNLQNIIDSKAVAYVAIVTSPVKGSLGEYPTKEKAERALVIAALSLGNVQGDVFPIIR